MNILDAARSGKRYRRPYWNQGSYLDHTSKEFIAFLSREDLLAEDWMIEEKKLELTKEEFIEKFKLAIQLDDQLHVAQASYPSLETLLRCLGWE